MRNLFFFVGWIGMASFVAAQDVSFVARFFNEINKDNVAEVCQKYYHADVEFVDPVHRVQSRTKIISYYQGLYQNVQTIKFVVFKELRTGDELMASWKMDVTHRAVNGGVPFSVEGVSHIRLKDDKIIYHRDYFDLGEMIYERVPILGRIIRIIKNKVAGA